MTRRSYSFLFTLTTMVAIPLLLGAKGGCGGEVAIGDDECKLTECGGMPELACADGSSPFTGRCLAGSDGKCAWEPRKCPDPTPTTCSGCAIPEIACPNGSSPYDGCVVKDSKCVANYKGCPATTCDACEIPTILCADGSNPYDGCVLKDGKCVGNYVGCATTSSCTPSECGPVPPVAPCPGGSGPPVTCDRKSDGKCSWTVGSCPYTACDKITTSLPRTCSIKSDCAFGLHQLNCCGSKQAFGYSASAASAFDLAETECRATYPACGCPASPTVDDSGKAGTAFEVDCVSGVCTTRATVGL